MIEKVHDQIVTELDQSNRTDTIFVRTAIFFNLIILAINYGVAEAAYYGGDITTDIIFGVFIIVTILVNTSAIIALLLGKKTRIHLLDGLIKMYKDSNVDKYYPEEMLSTYGKRYMLFSGVILLLALVAVLVPIIIRFL